MIQETEKDALVDTDSEDELNDQRLRQKMQSKGLNCTSKDQSKGSNKTKSGGKQQKYSSKTNKPTVKKIVPDGSILSSSRDTTALIPVPSTKSTKAHNNKILRAT